MEYRLDICTFKCKRLCPNCKAFPHCRLSGILCVSLIKTLWLDSLCSSLFFIATYALAKKEPANETAGVMPLHTLLFLLCIMGQEGTAGRQQERSLRVSVPGITAGTFYTKASLPERSLPKINIISLYGYGCLRHGDTTIQHVRT